MIHKDLLRANRRDARDYTIGLACLLVVVIGVIVWALSMTGG